METLRITEIRTDIIENCKNSLDFMDDADSKITIEIVRSKQCFVY